jgi:hypothetical protein
LDGRFSFLSEDWRWQIKGEDGSVHAMKAFKGSKPMDPLINVGARWRVVVNFKPQPLYSMGIDPPPIRAFKEKNLII